MHLTHNAIALEPLLASTSNACGASLLFTGTVREHNEGRPVNGMRYTAHEPLAEKALAEICREAEQQFAVATCHIVHRLGELRLGDISVAIVVHSAHRAAAYEASRFAIEALKARVPIFKQEFYTDGDARYLDGQTLDAAL
ncbi:molybdenum cofactor biosynthesis protein MoaE [Oceanococcus atlanticus]|nr:molybdenum cofactor biosynthesis protein MoaE [Oceanococcus atlanticus]